MDFIQKHKNIAKILIAIASLGLIATSILPFLQYLNQ